MLVCWISNFPAAYSTVAAFRCPVPTGTAHRAASSKQPRFFRRWRRFGCFPAAAPAWSSWKARSSPAWPACWISKAFQNRAVPGAPARAQRKRVAWGEEKQRNERAFPLTGKRGIWSLLRRCPAWPACWISNFPAAYSTVAAFRCPVPTGTAHRAALTHRRAIPVGRCCPPRQPGPILEISSLALPQAVHH